MIMMAWVAIVTYLAVVLVFYALFSANGREG